MNGQSLPDSVRQLENVTITQSRLSDYVIAGYQLPIDSTMLSLASNGSITDLLRKHGQGHIRSYGPGGLALPSFRGTGSSHTAILWNGINLVSPSTGQLDLSLVPAGLFDHATIQTGGSSSLSGNGSIGANIHLTNKMTFGEGLRLAAASHVGSFGSRYYDAGINFSNKRFGLSTKVFSTTAHNDFKFRSQHSTTASIQRREHAAFEQQGVLQQLHWQSEKAGIYSLKLWYQQSLYEIPNPTGMRGESKATENNTTYRLLGGWNITRRSFDINYQNAFIRHDLDYADPLRNEFSANRYNSVIQNIETNVYFNNESQLTSGIHYTWEEGTADNYAGRSPARNRFALFSAYKAQLFDRWNIALSGREEVVDGNPMPFSPSLTARYNLSKKFTVFVNGSRNYRIPTFNDLHWKGAGAYGNPMLKTEVSLNAEGGVEFRNDFISFKNVAFDSHVDNWIQWIPVRQAWTPQNIKKVWARGIESQLSFTRKIYHVDVTVSAQYSFTKSTNESVYDNGNANEKGKQLLLTPLHEGSLTAGVSFRNYSLRVVNSYTGEQFNDSDNTRSGMVDDYLITNLWLSKVLTRKHVRLVFIAEVNNALNVEYVARPGYPMPGRNYKAGIQFNFHKPTKL